MGVMPSSNMTGVVDMWDRLCPVPMCLPRRSASIGWVMVVVGWLSARAGPRDPPLP